LLISASESLPILIDNFVIASKSIQPPSIEPIKLKICFVTHNIYPVLVDQNDIKSAGGAELQQRFIGIGLKNIGYTVSYITMDVGQEELEIKNGMEIYKTHKLNEGIRGIRFLYPVLYKIWRALKKANADVYYVRCAGFLPGIVAIFCRMHKKKMIYAGAHDTDFIPSQFLMTKQYEKTLYKFGLKHADAITAQSNSQKANLWRHFKLKGELIRNFYPCHAKRRPKLEKDTILWVSTLRSWKRPMRFVRLAEKFPSEQFIMIGGRPGLSGNHLYDEIKDSVKNLKNLQFLGFQPFKKTECYFDRCKLFVNTSDYEGFPNTFLQAWNRGIPVLSYVDPDGVILQNKLGIVVHSENDMHIALSSFLGGNTWNSDSIVAYFNNHHSEKVIEEYDALLRDIVKESPFSKRNP